VTGPGAASDPGTSTAYCTSTSVASAASTTPAGSASAASASATGARAGPPFADCVLCGEPTEYGSACPGATLCPVCEWQEAQRPACSG
jgi:hypothetical protein